jgi:undecaprenyl-diphosphatase
MDTVLALKAVVMGLVEGATEFLPVSSTGHLILADWILGFGAKDGVFEVVIQAGAMLAVIWLYFGKLWKTLIGLPKDRTSQNFALAVAIGFLPAAVLGFAFHDYIKNNLFSPWVVSVSLIVGGVVLLFVDRIKVPTTTTSVDDLSFKTALKIGLFQCVAMIPGVSRSGATIVGALLSGVDRKTAAEFSFFLAIPTLMGAAAFDFIKAKDTLQASDMTLIAIGLVTAFVSALIVIKAFIAWLTRHGLGVFGWYRIVVGLVMLVWLRWAGA